MPLGVLGLALAKRAASALAVVQRAGLAAWSTHPLTRRREPMPTTVILEPYEGTWSSDDADAGFRSLVAEYTHASIRCHPGDPESSHGHTGGSARALRPSPATARRGVMRCSRSDREWPVKWKTSSCGQKPHRYRGGPPRRLPGPQGHRVVAGRAPRQSQLAPRWLLRPQLRRVALRPYYRSSQAAASRPP
jgi:hypothetical protein